MDVAEIRPNALVALGANLPSRAGGPADTLRAALDRLGDSGLRVAAVSRVFATRCFPQGAGPDYVSAAAVVTGAADPRTLLKSLHRVERAFGRERTQRWGRRVLDLDLLAFGDMVLPDLDTQARWRNLPLQDQMTCSPDSLVLPHPRIQDRAFVLIPLAEIAPDWTHSVLRCSVSEMADALPEAEKAQITLL